MKNNMIPIRTGVGMRGSCFLLVLKPSLCSFLSEVAFGEAAECRLRDRSMIEKTKIISVKASIKDDYGI